MPRILVLVSVALALPVQAQESLAGDAVHGGRAYRLTCAACHGVAGLGDGPMAPSLKPAPAPLRDGGVLYAHTDDEVIATVLNNTGMPDGAPTHGFGLSTMDVRDIIAWLKQPIPEPATFFSAASDYIAHRQTIDKYGLERVQKVLGEPLDDSEKSVMIYSLYRPANGATTTTPGHAAKIPEQSEALYEARPSRKLGYVAYLPLNVEGVTVNVAMAMNRNMRLTVVRTLPAPDEKTEKVRAHLTPILRAYVGSGGRTDKKPVETQHGPKAPKDVQAAMMKAYERLLEGAAMFEKEERERFWAEPEALKIPLADDQPSSVEVASDEPEPAAPVHKTKSHRRK